MHDNRTHPLLQQLPLTVSPFVNLPTATTLPYQYKPMPSTLPPSSTTITSTTATTPATSTAADDPASDPPSSAQRPKYVISPSGHAAHPDEILASCRALHAHVAQLQAQAERDLAEFTERIRARELAEKRRVAPGWLDSEARLLEPERPGSVGGNPGVVAGNPGYGGNGGSGSGGQGQEMLLQQPLQGLAGNGTGGYGNEHGHGPGGVSEMAVPDEGEELDRAFGGLQLRQS